MRMLSIAKCRCERCRLRGSCVLISTSTTRLIAQTSTQASSSTSSNSEGSTGTTDRLESYISTTSSTGRTRERRSLSSPESCSRLWQAVITQALSDIAIGRQRQRDEAIGWMISKDFLEVCEAADVEPGALRRLAQVLADTDDRHIRVSMIARIRSRLNFA